MRVLGVSGSLRRGSHNRRLLRAAAAVLPSGAVLLEWDGLADLPAFDEDLEASPPESVKAFRAALDDADALLIATPEHNASLPGALKNALDWASRPFPDNVLRDKPCAVIGASTGLFGAVWAQAEVRKVLKASGAQVIDAELPVGMAESAFGAGGQLAEPELVARLDDLLADLTREVKIPHQTRSPRCARSAVSERLCEHPVAADEALALDLIASANTC
jgi:chromate reductase, NAD(P)H dehydrogenase (quinone)